MGEFVFPRTEVGGISTSRIVIGTNWMLGWSHTGAAMDGFIKKNYADIDSFKKLL